MNFLALFFVALVALGAVFSTVLADYHKKPLEIKHSWKKHDYGKGGYGKGGGKKLSGYSKRYHAMKHNGKGKGGHHY